MMATSTTLFPYLFAIVVFFLGSACVYLPSLLLFALLFLRSSIPSTGFTNDGGSPIARESVLDFDSARSVGASLKRELDLVDEQIRRNNKTPADVYPANKITVRCHVCRKPVGAGEGYKHYKVGTRGTFCRRCHLQKGLPLRDDDIDKDVASAIIGGEEVDDEV